ncbi:hypothetical protein BX616_007438 [Lobosporangium transversale]|uniref:CBM1 domain-containing protein n=1 Tax=Lobosporangium transversale TaxID=64571 RepID=A0A1Y2GC45_9FUNG|nr:hypothetical protein BCR41DRAFT_413939 [Lobosporangium transversale]KAF9896443.1 hypothetical protein BX616_007438 [Lobosporangium transversale]ORZ04877.1 hypothetical protein BCR41DRAFT_413939 [Lobosporangium transversale]|eukprot:XP_021876814.1 hypothetical protein BCR41DRAFT_413939 [Lobosporangium transversale]
MLHSRLYTLIGAINLMLLSFLLFVPTESSAAPSPSPSPSPSPIPIVSDMDNIGAMDSGTADLENLNMQLSSAPSTSNLLLPPPPVVPQQDVQIESQTDIISTTGVFPKLIFRPAVQLFDPMVTHYQNSNNIPFSFPLPLPFPFSNSAAAPAIAYNDDLDDPTNDFYLSSAPPSLPPTSFRKRQLGPASGPDPAGVIGSSSSVSVDTLIKPIVTVQPHALQPVAVPVSQPYNYPVPVGVPVPWSCGTKAGAGCGTRCGTGCGIGGGTWASVGGNNHWRNWGDSMCTWGDNWGC